MKRRTVYKVTALCLSLSLFAAYVVARAAGWIGGESIKQPLPANNDAKPAETPESPQPPQDFFSGSKSAPVFTPPPSDPKPKPVLPGSKVLILDPLPKEITQPAPPKDAAPPSPAAQQPPAPKP